MPNTNTNKGIVHRDLKSLNLLLDSKWNLKVSDMGLTRVSSGPSNNEKDLFTHLPTQFKDELSRCHGNQPAGTVHWTAPEIVAECLEVDYALADIYSFGIILWELLTREQPYFGQRYRLPFCVVVAKPNTTQPTPIPTAARQP